MTAHLFSFLFGQCVADLPIDLEQPLFIEFNDRPIISHQAIELGLTVGSLGVDRCRETLEMKL